MTVVHFAKVSALYPQVVISSLAKQLVKPPFLPLLHFPWCMAHRSLHVITKVYYRSMSCFAMVSQQTAPLVVLRFPAHSGPFCTMWFSQFTQNVTKTNHKDRSHPHTTEHDTQPIAYLISKQVIPYRTRGGTYYPGVSTPMTRPLADSSMTNHVT
jgi:hypothetical protein